MTRQVDDLPSIGHARIPAGLFEVAKERSKEAIDGRVALGDRQRGWLVEDVLSFEALHVGGAIDDDFAGSVESRKLIEL